MTLPDAETGPTRVKTVDPVWNVIASLEMNDPTQIAEAVLEARREIIERVLSGPDGQDLLKLDAAYRALTGQPPPDLSAVLAQRNGAAKPDLSWVTTADTDPETPSLDRRGPREACKDLMLSGPMRTWTYDSIDNWFHDNRIVLDAKNPRDAMRTAMASLAREGIVKKLGRGRFRPVRDFSADNTQQEGDSTPAGGNGQGGV